MTVIAIVIALLGFAAFGLWLLELALLVLAPLLQMVALGIVLLVGAVSWLVREIAGRRNVTPPPGSTSCPPAPMADWRR